jgi:dTDP-4-amino-4,6-dideoxygalactose transaminase
MLNIKYVFSEPIQLTFDEAKINIIDYIIEKGWYTQGWQNKEQFRREFMAYSSMRELLASISFYGKWVF